LLETMQVRLGDHRRTTHILAQPFIVLADAESLEQEGTYPLPEAQLDRFLFKFEVPFRPAPNSTRWSRRTILKQHVEPTKVMDAARILALRQVLEKVVVADAVRDYAVAW